MKALRLAALALLPLLFSTQGRVLDAFDSVSGWTAHPSDGVSLAIASDSGYRDRAMRLDVDFRGGGGYAIARREITLDYPENYELTFWVRGTIPPNNLEFKLVDATGDNVWWVNRRDVRFTDAWTKVTIRKRHISFAWGPLGGGELTRSAAMEIAITAGSGGRGSVWIDELSLTPLEPVRPYDRTPAITASSEVSIGGPAFAIDGRRDTRWRSQTMTDVIRRDDTQWLAFDFLQNRELGGLAIDWDSLDFAVDYAVQTSPDGARWESVRTVRGGNGGRDYLFLPETEARYLRLLLMRSNRGQGYGIIEAAVQPLAWSATANDFFAAIARDAPRGDFPKYLTGTQSYWTVVGVSGDPHEAMINEEGMLETGKAGFSIEPSLRVNDRLITWADARTSQSLEDGYLPIPTVHWDAGPLALTVTAYATGYPGSSTLWAWYRVVNRSRSRQQSSLYLAIRPFQVNPVTQFLNTPGGVARVESLASDGRTVTVNGTRRVVSLTAPAGWGAATFDQGTITEHLRQGRVPATRDVSDSFGYASGAFEYRLDLGPADSTEVLLAIPFAPVPAMTGAATPGIPAPLPPGQSARTIARAAHDSAVAIWRQALDRVAIDLPPDGHRLSRTIKSNLAYILINRDGPAIQPGSRSYERSWIRDGALTSAAMLRLGHAEEVRQFIEWYAPYQYASGKVPCCVDHRGADPVPEHDSHGELIYLIAEYHRFTRDTAFLARLWPHVRGAVAYIDSLRAQRMTSEYRTPEKLPYYGLVPQSISHEGYSAKPMHSYWDDTFVLRGLTDAAEIAAILGKRDTIALFAAKRDEFRGQLMESYRRTMAMHGIDYLPGSVELGDFDATSTTVAVAPGGEQASLPQPALDRTFEKYLRNFRLRRDSSSFVWDAYTPYELRVVGTFVRLGRKEIAHELLDFFFRDHRPPGWNHWAEVVGRDAAAPRFIGDMPHTWVGSDYIRSVTDMFAYEREADSSLIIGAGIVDAWVTAPPGVRVRGLHTHYGVIDYTMSGTASEVRVQVSGTVRVPRGGVIVRSPFARAITGTTVDVGAARAGPAEVVITRLPATVVLRYGAR